MNGVLPLCEWNFIKAKACCAPFQGNTKNKLQLYFVTAK